MEQQERLQIARAAGSLSFCIERLERGEKRGHVTLSSEKAPYSRGLAVGAIIAAEEISEIIRAAVAVLDALWKGNDDGQE